MATIRPITGTLPAGHDQYFTQIKVKYLTGLATSNATYSVATAGVHSTSSYRSPVAAADGNVGGKLSCDATLPIVSSTGTTYYIPCFRYGAGL